MDEEKPRKPVGIRTLNAFVVLAICASLTWIVVAGMQWTALALLAGALGVACVPVVTAGDGIGEWLAGLVEALVDGITALVDCVIAIVEGIFDLF